MGPGVCQDAGSARTGRLQPQLRDTNKKGYSTTQGNSTKQAAPLTDVQRILWDFIQSISKRMQSHEYCFASWKQQVYRSLTHRSRKYIS